MKITKSKLKQIIQEEFEQIILEMPSRPDEEKVFMDVIRKLSKVGLTIGSMRRMYQNEMQVEGQIVTAVTHPEVNFPGDIKGTITLYIQKKTEE